MRRQKSWLDRLSRAARWRLGAKEAGEVIADYREIVGDPPRSEEELVRDLGKPLDAVKPLTDPKAYRLWLAVFAVMAGCILMLGISPLSVGLYLWQWLFYIRPFGLQLGPVVAAAGAVVTLIWSRWRGEKRGRLSKAVPVLLAVCLTVIAGVLLFYWACIRDLDGFVTMWGTMNSLLGPHHTVYRSVYLSTCAMSYGASLLAAVGVFALVRARTEDRRWAAVYVLAMAAILTALMTVALLTCMDITVYTPEERFGQQLVRCAVIAALGLIGTGVALC